MVSTERGGWMTGAPIINEREPGFLILVAGVCLEMMVVIDDRFPLIELSTTSANVFTLCRFLKIQVRKGF
jgi:hypothetical protein